MTKKNCIYVPLIFINSYDNNLWDTLYYIFIHNYEQKKVKIVWLFSNLSYKQIILIIIFKFWLVSVLVYLIFWKELRIFKFSPQKVSKKDPIFY